MEPESKGAAAEAKATGEQQRRHGAARAPPASSDETIRRSNPHPAFSVEYSTLPEAIPRPHENDKEVPVDKEKEAIPFNPFDPGDENNNHGTPSIKGLSRLNKRCCIVFGLVCLLVAIGLGCGLGVALSRRHEDPASVAQTLVGGDLDPTYFSTSGAYNGSAIAVVPSLFFGSFVPDVELLLFYQHYTGQVRCMQLMSNDSWLAGPGAGIVVSDAKLGTPLDVVTRNVREDAVVWQMLYIDTAGRLRQVQNSTDGWQEDLVDSPDVSPLQNGMTGFMACQYGQNENVLLIGEQQTSLRELWWGPTPNSSVWTTPSKNATWYGLDGQASPVCMWGALDNDLYIAAVDLQGAVRFYRSDPSKIGDDTDTWSQVSNSSIPDTIPSEQLAYSSGILWAQSSIDSFVYGYNLSAVLEHGTVYNNAGGNRVSALRGTRLAATEATDVVDIDTIVYISMVFYQLRGDDILLYEQVNDGSFSYIKVPIPAD